MKLILNNSTLLFKTRTPSQRTLNLLANYSKEFSYAQILAVDDFLYDLEAYGLSSKISALYIPALAGSVSEVFVNVMSDTFVNTHPNIEASSNIILSNGAFNKISTGYELVEQSIANNYLNNFHILAFVPNELTDTDRKPPFGTQMGTYGLQKTYTTFMLNGIYFVCRGILINNKTCNSNYNYHYLKRGLFGFCSDTVNDADGVRTYNYGQANAFFTWTSSIENVKVDSFSSDILDNSSSPSALMSFGAKLTQEEVAKYNQLVNTLLVYLEA